MLCCLSGGHCNFPCPSYTNVVWGSYYVAFGVNGVMGQLVGLGLDVRKILWSFRMANGYGLLVLVV